MNVLERFSLEGKVAVVTGASSGLGVAFSESLAQAGANVALGGRRVDRLEVVRGRIENGSHKAIAVKTDVSKPEDCEALAEATKSHLGRLDILVNCAGVGTAVPASRETPEQFRSVIETNLMGSYWMAQACAKFMAPGSCIVNVSSVLALTSMGLPQAAYTSSKAAVIGLTRDLAQQWGGRKGIRVNAIVPGYFPSEMTDDLKDGFLENTVLPRVPMGRLGFVEECAAAVVFLASDAASYITGVCLPVDGGLLTL